MAAVLGVAEPDLIEQQLFCTKVRRISALEWLAVSNFLSTTISRSYHFHPTTKAALEIEKRATLLAAKLLMASPANAMQELNRFAQSHTDGWKPLLISSENLIARAPTRYMSRRGGVMALPTSLTELLHHYIDDLIVYREGRGFAVNPDKLEAGSDGCLGISLRGETSTDGSAASSKLEFIPLRNLTRAIRQMNIVLHGTREAEELIGATSRQRLALIRLGLLRPLEGSTFVLSSEIDRFLRWLRDNSTLTMSLSSMVPLSELAPTGRMLLQRVMTAAIEGRVGFFRQSGDSARLDTCFITKSSLAALVR
ncbi:hypothetical protein A6V36_01830 [Paraburkholderia ginsengiterrae]|uniref:Channel forming colicins domain-containing protein n=1 Tax=Paraburkholderia ginsengiterrae TaxID=1462993 RepID=A0ABX2UZ49_9BURK|nr:hypothetical protein A6V36_01830 [Paraburkholderia ginsengiterrae]